jgi:beta-D-galactosyl-(1->4)-L-rhamnose phosphorylase
MHQRNSGSFTLPGEAGYEDLTLELAERWGVDAIRDSDGTQLSDKILSSGYNIYSTICLIRSDNAWAKKNRDKLQQNYLMSNPVISSGNTATIDLLKGYFTEQFEINGNDDPKVWWQVFDRTTGTEVSKEDWEYNSDTGKATIYNAKPWHRYTVNFLVYRIWEAISMYNHITNGWGSREHLMPLDPIYPETQAFILQYLEKWLREHPHTDVVRFTSLFYNFSWFWGEDPNLKFRYSDWGSYCFTVTPYAMKQFERKTGIRMTSEDFIDHGLYNNTHNIPSKKHRAWMDFINDFVVSFGSKCVDLVHQHGKKAYVFYDDHWIGMEPYHKRFADFRFDGIVKCVFNAFEARKCAGVEGVETHELRLHPYLFPTGLQGEPTFMEGGNPTNDAKRFWMNIRRALLRDPVQRIGLGGYLHMVEKFPDFIDYIASVAQEFRLIKSLHENGKPWTASCKIAVLTAWGSLRSWICSGHMHENPNLDLNHVYESLAGLPVDVTFISFDDIRRDGIPKDVKVIINCGRLDSAWSGGDHWKDPDVVTKITGWVAAGGGFIGIGEPSASKFSSQYFQLSHILGVEREIGLTVSKNKYSYQKENMHFIFADNKTTLDLGGEMDGIYAIDGETAVLEAKNGHVQVAVRAFGKGRGVYLSGFRFNPQNTRMLYRAILWAAANEDEISSWLTDNINTECTWFPHSRKLVIMNNGEKNETVHVIKPSEKMAPITLKGYELQIIEI